MHFVKFDKQCTFPFMFKSVCFIILSIVITPLWAFNIEREQYVTHQGSFDSKFGFSIAEHRDASGNFWVIVGAPESQTSQPNVTQAGAVFRCHPRIPNKCDMIPFDDKGNHHDGSQYIDDKSRQWFGASVASKGEVIAACAPRYVWYSIKKNRREPIGRCFVLIDEGSNLVETYSPCMNEHWGYHRQGTCQAGFGMDLTKGGNRLYIGAVGSWYWQGQIFYSNLLNKKDILTISESPKKYDMSYLGFSITSGYFDEDSEEDVAVGVPRGDELRGKVVILSFDLKVLYNITGEQMGSYFGYSVAALDVDGDHLQDIVVGAPWYTKSDSPSSKYEVGMASCFIHTPEHNFRIGTRLHGEHSRSHFGLSVTSLKDLNRDGFEDLAVGAPGGGIQGSGAVYIYLGSPKGLMEDPSQVLFAEELIHVGIQTFGWSLSGGQDLDGNGYPDLAVGAHESDRAYVFSARPVVEISASIKIKSKSGAFELKKHSCLLLDGSAVPCTALQFCLSYTGHRVPSSLSLAMSISLDTNAVEHPRVFFLKHEQQSVINSSVATQKDVRICSSLYIYSLPSPYDKLTPIHVELSYGISPRDDRRFGSSFPHLFPILTPPQVGRSNKAKDTIYFQNNCGKDNICIPDLSLEASLNTEEYVLGSAKNLLLNLYVTNQGDDAYQSVVEIFVPEAVHFSRYVLISNGSLNDVTPFCTAETKKHDVGDASQEESDAKDQEEPRRIPPNKRVKCEVGNPLPSKAELSLQLTFQPDPDFIRASTLSFALNINSTNQEDSSTIEDNALKLTIPVLRRSDIDLRGISWPEEVLNYNSSFYGESLLGQGEPIKHENETGPSITHIYDAVNWGPSDLPNVDLYLVWPSSTQAGDPLLYLVEDPKIVAENLHCESTPLVNYLDIEVVPSLNKIERPPFEDSNNDSSPFSHSRKKREVALGFPPSANLFFDNSSKSEPEPTPTSLDQLLSCGSTECSITKCSSSLLKADQHIFVYARSRLWADTIRKIGISDMKISSRLVIHSRDEVTGEERSWSEEVTSLVKARVDAPIQSLSWLIWLGSCLAGLFVLALIILLLWLLGFFKRRRPKDELIQQSSRGKL